MGPYITTAIDYVNSKPHAGHAVEKIQADVLSRFFRLLGREVFFLTGTDENSLKNVQAAREEGISPKELVERHSKEFRKLGKILNLSFDDFIRTTERRHIEGVQKLWQACQKDIYKKKYRGLYCLGCENFYKENELKQGLCPEHKTKPKIVEEENYFFKLTPYQKKLRQIIAGNQIEIIPQTRKNEVLNFIDSGLEDFCISRSSKRAQGWGIEVPGDSSQIIWVWFDALSNYINALSYSQNSEDFRKWWQENENIYHIIGKGILRFHAICWPAMLLSAGLNLPRKIFVHEYLTIEGQKISKSLGNVIFPSDLVDKFGTDAVRYLLISALPSSQDGDISWERLQKKYNADLANGIGNLLGRVVTLIEKYGRLKIESNDFSDEIERVWQNYYKEIKDFRFKEAQELIWYLIKTADKYINEKKPWENLDPKVLSNLWLVLANIGWMLKPFMPDTAQKILESLGADDKKESWQGKVYRVKKGGALFPRIK